MQQQKRIHTIDGIRGFSLLGILLANLLIFQYGMWGKEEITYFNISKLDQGIYTFIKIAIEDSFLPIFTFLFGYTFMMMRNSLKRRKLRIKWHLFRRSLMLIVMGLLHSILLWEGDILFLYGMMGIILLLFVNRKAKTILIWSIVLFSFLALISLFDFLDDTDNDPLADMNYEPYIEEATNIYSLGTYSEIKEYRNNADDPLMDKLGEEKLGLILIMLPFIIAPMFLLGMYAAKKEWFMHVKKEQKMYWIGMIIFLVSGLIIKTFGYFQNADGVMTIGGPALALGYMFLFGLIYSKYKQGGLLRSFEMVGKLSLTNYIIQTVICTTIFYGYGLGLFGKIGVLSGLLLGIIIYAGQVFLSTYYLKHFRYGPLEKLLRMWTYLSVGNKT